MKTSILCLLALLGVTGCGKSQSTSNAAAGQAMTTVVQPANDKITAEQARATAVRLANDKCDSLYQQHPFRASNLPVFMGGRWVWTAVQGVGLADAEVKVE